MEFMSSPNPYSGLGGKSSDIPDFADFADAPASDACNVTLGVGPEGPVSVDLDAESPHILVNAPTGMGKSAVARSVAVQGLCRGDLVVFLDVKMHSHRWARDLAPLTFYADTDATVGAALVNLGRELHRRNQVVRDFDGDIEDALVGPRIIVVFEETNATLTHLAALDKTVASGGYKAMDAFRDLMFMGRAVKMHVVAFAQLASYRSGLSADLIENFGTKVLISASQKAWKWLVPECGTYRSTPEIDGRALVCRGNRARETQLLWVEEEDAPALVLASLPAQQRARELSGTRANLPSVWRQAISR
jgi:hypothetical protein